MPRGALIRASFAIAAFALFATCGQAWASDIIIDADNAPVDDPLHGYCGSSYAGSSCTDNGVITPFGPGGIAGGFGFASDPLNLSGSKWLIDILVPTNITGAGSEAFTVNKIDGGTGITPTSTSAVNEGVWSTGDLASFLGLPNSKPANKIGAFAVGADSAVTGFYVYQALFNCPSGGAACLYNQPNSISPPAPLLTITGSSILPGVEITSFLVGTSGKSTVATAPSSVLQATGTTTVPEPTTFAMLLAGFGACVVARRRLQVE
ncbi:MAG TPA: PEP-CTERM sorting domain-containing protein [Vicinamibacterales bacterium]|nr:PEP-CTERM sorting domain-containing protein [Vicinamibacterales bacterium]